MNIKELEDQVVNLKNELLKLRFQAATGQLQQLHKLRATKKEIAKTLTKINLLKKEVSNV